MKEITTSVYTFEDMIRGNVLYVDKTAQIYRMVSVLKGQFFCARPRRFGKSLMVSTLEALFKGKKELFQGLAISQMDYDWDVYPIVHIDFSRADTTSEKSLTSWLKREIERIGSSCQVAPTGDTLPLQFDDLLYLLNKEYGKGVVILIDEYDKPIMDHLEMAADAENFRALLDRFYQVIKGAEPFLRFVFITGVTRIAKVSIFSKLNNLNDITGDLEYADMFGYTQKELEENFADYLDEALREKVTDNYGNELDREQLLSELKRWYDGFCFSDGAETVYNPVSVGMFFNKHCRFSNYWFSTGTPTFLMKLMKKNHLLMQDMQDLVISDNSLNTFDLTELASETVNNERIEQILYQTGYLTIDHLIAIGPTRMYQMRYPNYEVEESFISNLVGVYSGEVSANSYVNRIRTAAYQGDPEQMIALIKDFFDNLPYDLQIKAEKYYHAMVYMMFRMCGFHILSEEKTSIGRIDAVLEAGRYLYIIEFKLEKSAEAAIAQIDDKRYADKYRLQAKERGQQICEIGIAFCYAKNERTIKDSRIKWLES